MDVIALIALGLALALWYRLRQLSREVDALRRSLGQPLGREQEPVPSEPAPAAPASPRPARSQPRSGIKLPTSVNWMAWLGGILVGLAGIFLVKYSIDHGWLGPPARVLLGIVSGLCMHAGVAWYLRRTGRYHPALSALAAAGSITICAAILAALHLYEFVAPLPAFAALAVLFLATMALALRHGPILAALGLLGGYAVPLLVGGDTDGMAAALAYATIVSACGLLMVRYAYRRWLWWCMLVAALGWNLISLGNPSADGLRGLYLAALAAGLVFLPSLDWWPRLRAIGPLAPTWRSMQEGDSDPVASGKPPVWWGLAWLTLVQGVTIASEPFTMAGALLWAALPVTVYWACRSFPRYWAISSLIVAVQAGAWLSTGFDADLGWEPSLVEWMPQMVACAAVGGLVHVFGSLWQVQGGAAAKKWLPLTVVGPLSLLAVAFFLATDNSSSAAWAAAGLIVGCAYAATGMLCQSRGDELGYSWCVAGCSGAYSLAAVMFFRDAGLTVALAAQAVPLAWIAARAGTPVVQWMTKGALAAVVLRLSLNPWMETYASETNWVVLAYCGSTLAAFLASALAKPLPSLQRWTEAAAVQMLVLTLWAVPRSWIHGGSILGPEYGLGEAAYNTAIWAALGLIYYRRSQLSEHIAAVYLWASRALLALSLANYAVVLLVLNPLWTDDAVSATPLLNLLLLAYGAPVLLAGLAARFSEPAVARWAVRTAAMAAFVFVSLEVRHLWQGALDLGPSPSDGEMATYSIAWTCMAFAAVLAGGMRFGASVYRAGMALLLLTVAKVFLVDMAGLSGLLRAGSFLGLGLSLLGLALLHQRFGAVSLQSEPAQGRAP